MFGNHPFGTSYFGQGAGEGTLPPTVPAVYVQSMHVEDFAQTGPRGRNLTSKGPKAKNLESI